MIDTLENVHLDRKTMEILMCVSRAPCERLARLPTNIVAYARERERELALNAQNEPVERSSC